MKKLIKNNNAKRTEINVYFSLFFYVTMILFIVSPDSYTHDIMGQIDSSCFFMSGKAWMNGMKPYVDFADSKGPLLWLICGIAYLISSYDYVGVFWLNCISSSVALFVCYKIGCLLTNNNRKGYLVALLMAFPYFFLKISAETRSEAWCQPFIAVSLYWLLREILHPSNKSFCMAGIVHGISFMAIVLIKWSVGAMMLSFFISDVVLLISRKKPVCIYVSCFIVAAIILFAPFAAYFFVTDSFGAFVNEYFINTGKTVSDGGTLNFVMSYFQDIKHFLLIRNAVFIVAYIIAIYLYYRKHRSVTILPLLCGLFFLAIAIKHNIWDYYLDAVPTFAVFLVAIIVNKFVRKEALTYRRFFVIYFVAMVLNFANAHVRKGRAIFFFRDKGRKEFYEAAYLMSQRHNPTIMYSGTDIGLGLSVNSLPGTVYWVGQVGMTDEMRQSRWNAVKRNMPDFIAIKQTDKELRQRAIEAGFQYYLTLTASNQTLDFYGPRGLCMPPKDFYVSDMDILLKRKIKFADR